MDNWTTENTMLAIKKENCMRITIVHDHASVTVLA